MNKNLTELATSVETMFNGNNGKCDSIDTRDLTEKEKILFRDHEDKVEKPKTEIKNFRFDVV